MVEPTPEFGWYSETEDGNTQYYLVANTATVDTTTCQAQLYGLDGACTTTTVTCFDNTYAARGTVADDQFLQQEDGTWYYIGATTPGLVETGASVTDATTNVTTFPASNFSSQTALADSGACAEPSTGGFNVVLFLLIIVLIGAIGFGAKTYMDNKKKTAVATALLDDEEKK